MKVNLRKPKKVAQQQKADVKSKSKARDRSGDVEMQDADVDNVFSSDAEEEPDDAEEEPDNAEEEPDDDDVEASTRTSAANLRGSIGNDTPLNSY